MLKHTINGTVVDLDAAYVEFKPFWQSEYQERRGHKPNAVMGFLFVEAFREDGSRYAFVVNVKHINAVRKATVLRAREYMMAMFNNDLMHIRIAAGSTAPIELKVKEAI